MAYAVPEHANAPASPDDHLKRVMAEFVVDDSGGSSYRQSMLGLGGGLGVMVLGARRLLMPDRRGHS